MARITIALLAGMALAAATGYQSEIAEWRRAPGGYCQNSVFRMRTMLT
ncbi:MAG: hypothetical protein LAQ69_07190 [Acidobacteriia bacterium]|nr:hypothetical protein [Terriglobia bacterium]